MSYDREKYAPGMCRYSERTPIEWLSTHLYELGDDIMDFKLPMCTKGWNGAYGESYSILRNNVSQKGICKNCIKRAEQGLPGVLPKNTPIEEVFAEEESA